MSSHLQLEIVVPTFCLNGEIYWTPAAEILPLEDFTKWEKPTVKKWNGKKNKKVKLYNYYYQEIKVSLFLFFPFVLLP